MLNPRQIRILVVDDERAIRELLTTRFTIFGFQTVHAEDGQQAWGMICADSSIKIVITDLVMPKLDGKQLLQRCRGANAEFPRVFVMTGQAHWPVEELFAYGADGLLLKPFDARTLLNISRNALLSLEERLRYAPYKKSHSAINMSFASIEEALNSGRFALGRGGIFVDVPDTLPDPGEYLQLNIKLGDVTMEGVGVLRWRRSDPGQHNSAGLEFVHLAPKCIDPIEKWIQQLGVTAFIPSPQISTSMPSTAKLQSTG